MAAPYNAKTGVVDYADRTSRKTYFRAGERNTKTVTIKAGEVLKGLSFIEADVDGKSIASDGAGEVSILAMDVDATAGDVQATAFTKCSFWADALVWSVDIATDIITLADGTEVACTAYDTSASTDLLKQKLVDGTGFSELGFLTAGESY